MKIAAWVAPEAPRVTSELGWAGIPWKPSRATHSQADLGSQVLKIADSRSHSQPGMRELGWEVGRALGGNGDEGRIPKGQNWGTGGHRILWRYRILGRAVPGDPLPFLIPQSQRF